MVRRAQRRAGRGTGERRAQASLIGLVLVFGMVLAGTGLVVTLGASALTDTQTQSELERAEHSLTLFNSRTSMVALGNSDSQSVSFGVTSGQFESTPDSGWLRVTHADFTGGGDDEVIFNESLGAIVYRNGETSMAYQGGGVWRKDPQGEAQMISPPEFHYRGATLTLPVIRVESDADGEAGSTATVTKASQSKRVFPNETGPTGGVDEIGAPYDGTDREYVNPVANGTVNITVKSDYYEGWASYFRQRTEGTVTEFPDKSRVRVTLTSLAGSVGNFEMPSEGTDLQVSGLGDDHPINSYELTLKPDPHFQNMHWSFYADQGNEQFELHFFSDGQCTGGPGGGSYNGDLDVSIYYYNSSGGSTIHEEWQNESVNVGSNPDFDVDCSSGELRMDLLSSTTMEYDDLQITGSDNKWFFGPELDSRDVPSSTTSFTFHNPDGGDYTAGQEEQLGFLVNHYLQLLGPQFDLTVTDGPGGSSRVDESASSGELSFDTSGGGQFITFLHITENRVTVSFD